MADRRPLATPGRISEIVDGDRAIVSGIVRTEAGDLTFEDPVTGSKTLAQLAAGGGGSGDVVGPAGATDEAVARFDLTTGKLLQNSVVTITDAGAVSGVTTLGMSGDLTLSAGNIGLAALATIDGRDPSVDGGVLDGHVGSTIKHLPASLGTALQQLRVNAGATAPEWFTASAGSGDVTAASNFGTDNRVIRSDGTLKGVQASALTVEDTGSMLVESTVGDTGLVTSLSATGSNGALTQVYSGTRNPEGLVTALPGAMYYRVNGTSSRVYQLRSSASANTPWVELVVSVLSGARRTSGALITGSSYIGFDSETFPTNAAYWTFDSAGTWQCTRAHTARICANFSFFASTSGVGSILLEIMKGVGGVYATVIQSQRSSAEQITDNYTTMSAEGFFTFAVNDQLRLYVTNYGGSPNSIANMTTMSVHYAAG